MQNHPRYTKHANQRYCIVFDVYSLGLVLLQLGLWRSFTDIVNELFQNVHYSLDEAKYTIENLAKTTKNSQSLQDNLVGWQDQIHQQQQGNPEDDRFREEETARLLHGSQRY